MVRGTKFNLMSEVIINEVGPRDGLQNIETVSYTHPSPRDRTRSRMPSSA